MELSLRIGLPASLAKLIVPEQLPSLLAKYPDLELRLVEGTPQWLIDLTLAQEIDLAITLGPLNDKRLIEHRIAAEPVVLISSGSNDLVPPGLVDLTRTPPLKLALPWGQGSVRSVIDQHILSGQISVDKIVGINTLGPIIDLVKNSDWMTILPASVMLLGLDKGLICREVVCPEIIAEHFVIRPVSCKCNEVVFLFMKEIYEALRKGKSEQFYKIAS